MRKMVNRTHIAGVIYEHDLELKVTGPASKAPGTEFINGTLSVATDDEQINIVPVHFSYVTEVTSKGKPNATFGILKDIIDGKYGSVMGAGKENAAKIRIDSAIGLNEFYTDRNGQEELVSVKRNEGGFVHIVPALDEAEKDRNTFEVDIVITGVKRIEADEERGTPEKCIVKGAIFDFKNALLPVDFSVVNPGAMSYFEGLDATSKTPVFTKIKGRQVSETVVKTITEESAFGEASVREVKNTRKDFVITWAAKETYVWDDEDSITAIEFADAIAQRNVYLAAEKKRSDEWKAQQKAAPKAKSASAPAAAGGYDF